jgi:hypothetical protein
VYRAGLFGSNLDAAITLTDPGIKKERKAKDETASQI